MEEEKMSNNITFEIKESFNKAPSFVIAVAAWAICSAETPISCPIAIVCLDLTDQYLGAFNIPTVSPGK